MSNFFVVYALVLGDFNANLTQQRNDLNCNERRMRLRQQRQAISNFPNELSGNGHLASGLKKWACRNVGQELANDL